ncbi:MAG: sodium:proton exchanger [Chloroflexota bacterium]|nr:sodium:proton exchanger [Chloroflexota bacterium]
MTTTASNGKLWASVVLLVGAGIPGVTIRLAGIIIDPALEVLIFGVGIVGGAFLLSWAAEVAQMDISASLAIAVLAFIAVLPEYMIEATLAWNAGESYSQLGVAGSSGVTKEMSLVAANVTGSNRLLVGLGWSAVIILFWLRRRKGFDMRGLLTLEMPMLLVATLLTLIVAFTKSIPIWLAVVCIGAYIFYLWRSSTQEAKEPELIGAGAMIAGFRPLYRRMWVLALFIYSAAVIVIAAEPFVVGLQATGEQLGVSEFLLIQWIAPLASESPEIIVAVLFALRANPDGGLTTIISSQVNQLTLLVGSIVVVFSISAGAPLTFPLDYFEPSNFFVRLASPFGLQASEFLFTAAMAAFAMLLASTRIVKLWHGLTLFAIFVAYLVALWALNFFGGIDTENVPLRMWSSVIVFTLAALLVALNWRRVVYIFKGVPHPATTGIAANAKMPSLGN